TRQIVAAIAGWRRRLLRRRHVRDQRQAPLPAGAQTLIWLDGEALCVTREFRDDLHGRLPDWLTPAGRCSLLDNQVSRSGVAISGERRACLVRRHARRPFAWLWPLFRQRPRTSPELRQAALLFRLQRYGIRTPRLLAVGQRHLARGSSESFLLTEPA